MIEAELFSGRLLGVTATCALELGMDIGDLDVSVVAGQHHEENQLFDPHTIDVLTAMNRPPCILDSPDPFPLCGNKQEGLAEVVDHRYPS